MLKGQLEAWRIILQAGRVRGVYADVILQVLSALPDYFTQNIDGRVMFKQNDPKERKIAAELTGLKPENFDARVLKRYHAWLKVGEICKDVVFPKAPEAIYEVDYEDDEDDTAQATAPQRDGAGERNGSGTAA